MDFENFLFALMGLCVGYILGLIEFILRHTDDNSVSQSDVDNVKEEYE